MAARNCTTAKLGQKSYWAQAQLLASASCWQSAAARVLFNSLFNYTSENRLSVLRLKTLPPRSSNVFSPTPVGNQAMEFGVFGYHGVIASPKANIGEALEF